MLGYINLADLILSIFGTNFEVNNVIEELLNEI